MKIKGEFILREIIGDNVLIPVGETATVINGMIALNKTGAVIWKGLQDGKTDEQIIDAMVERFEVEKNVVEEDYKAFTDGMKNAGILE